MNIEQLLTGTKAHTKKTFAVLENSENITYGDLSLCVDKLSIVFSKLNLKQQDKILLSTQDKRSYTEILISAFRYGLAVVLIDPNAKVDRVKAIVQSVQPNAFFIDAQLKIDWAIDSAAVIEVNRQTSAKKKFFQKVFSKNTLPTEGGNSENIYPACLNQIGNESPKYPNSIESDNIAYIIYTSGSTSDPKGVVISHKNLFAHLKTLSEVYGLNDESRLLNLLNVYHVDGVVQGPLLALDRKSVV